MARFLVCDEAGHFCVDIEANSAILSDAIDDPRAEPVVRSAVMLALASLAEGGAWPTLALETLSGFMSGMLTELSRKAVVQA